MAETLAWDILARDHMSDALDKMARTAELLATVLDKLGGEGQSMGRKMAEAEVPAKHLGDEIDRLGDKSVKTAIEIKALDHEIEATEGKLKSLANAFQATGDKSLVGEFRKAKSELSTLKKMAEEIEPDNNRGGLFARIRNAVGRGIGSGIDFGVNLIKAHPIIAGALAAAIMGGAPLIAGALGGVVALALGGGALAGGIALAAADAKVSGAFHELANNVMGPLFNAAKVLVGPLQYAAGALDAAFRHIEPSIRRIFDMLGPVTSRLAGAFGQFLERAMPGIEKAIGNSVPFFNVLANELPKIGSELGDLLERVTRSKGAVEALTVVFDLIRVTLRGTGMALEWLSNRFSDWMHGIDIWLGALASLPTPLKAILGISTWVDGAAKSFHGYVESLAPAATGTSDLDRETRKLVTTASELDNELKVVQSEWDKLFGKTVSAAKATDTANTALLGMTDALKQNGRSLDANNLKGIANREILLSGVEAIRSERQANLENGMSMEEANRRYDAQIARLIKNAEAAGLNKDKIFELIGAMRQVPGTIPTDFQLKGLNLAEDDIREYKRLLFSVPQSVPVGVASPYRADNHPFRASGGSAAGFTRVGENGPEDVYLPPGSFVRPNNQITVGGSSDEVIGVLEVRHIGPNGEQLQTEFLNLARRRGYRSVEQLLPV